MAGLCSYEELDGSARTRHHTPMPSATPDGGLPAELHRFAKSDRLVTYRLLRRGPASQAELVAATRREEAEEQCPRAAHGAAAP